MTSTSADRRLGVNSGIAVKVPCRVATTAAITLSGEQTIDGVAVVTGDRVLVKDQSTTTYNGIWICDTGDWSRAVDADGLYDITDGTLVPVAHGTVGGGKVFQASGTNPITPGTSAVTFAMSASFGVISAFIATLLDDADAATARATLGAWGGASADIASAATLDLRSVSGIVRVTGTVATTAVTINAGQRVECIAVHAWPLTYHATNMPLPTNGVNYTCSGTDKVIFTKDNNGDLTIQIEKRSGFANAGGGDAAITLGALGTVAQITANQNDYSGVLTTWGGARLWSDAARDITGITGGWNSRTLALHNAGAYAITLKDESASSTAANRFALTADIVMQPDAVVVLQYDATTERWRAVGSSPIVYSGSAPVYGCRAWVNFNGTGTPAIRASGNVTSITDNGTGDYTINFTTALPDADYSCVGNHSSSSSGVSSVTLNNSGATAPTTSACRVNCFVSGAAVDPTYVNLAFFR